MSEDAELAAGVYSRHSKHYEAGLEAVVRMNPEPQPIPVKAGKNIAETYGYHQVIIIARAVGEGGTEHVTTYGVDKLNCDVAAYVGNFLKHKIMGWPEYVPAQATVGPWRPISEAKQDGTPYLIGWYGKNGWTERRAWWAAEFAIDSTNQSEETVFTGAWTDGAVKSFSYEETQSYEPTHFMPLPTHPPDGASS